MIKLIALDLDGTLLDPPGRITEPSRQAVARAQARGVHVVLNTGRSIQEALWFARQAGICGLVAALGGAAVADSASGEVLLRRDMEEPWGRRALALCLDRDIELMIFAGSQILLDPFSRRSLQRSYPFPVFHQASVTVEDPLAYLEEQQLPMTKIHGDGNPETYPLAELERLPGVTLTASSDRDFEVVPAGTDKGTALAWMARWYGIPLEACAAVGDSANDLAMLRAAGHPIAMGNAARAVREAARVTAPPNSREGAAWAIASCLET